LTRIREEERLRRLRGEEVAVPMVGRAGREVKA
jgi:hypothetical protein